MGKIVTTSEVKAILQISGSTYDVPINAILPSVENFILKYCNITEDSASVATGLKLPAAQMVNYQLNTLAANISSETIGGYSVSYNNSYPAFIFAALRPYRQIKFVQDTSESGNWYYDLLDEFDEANF